MQTKNGVVYDLKRSSFISSYQNLMFYFSSATHLTKFEDNILKRIEWLNHSMSKRFHVDIDVSILAVLQLYIQTETRGFLVYDYIDGVFLDCQENITLHGLKISSRNLIAQSEDTTMLLDEK